MALKCKKGIPCGGACIRNAANCRKEFGKGTSGDLQKASNTIKGLKAAARGQSLEDLEHKRNALLDSGIRAAKAGDNEKYGHIQLDFIKVQKEINVMKGIEIPATPSAATIKGFGKTATQDKEFFDNISRILRGESPKGGTFAHRGWTEENAKAFKNHNKFMDEHLKVQKVTEGTKKSYDWEGNAREGVKLGSGSYGSVTKVPGSSEVVKRGDVSATEAKLVKKMGEADLGPKLIYAETGPKSTKGDPLQLYTGRIAMTLVPGEPLGSRRAEERVGNTTVGDAYWKARADMHRLGVAHNDTHTQNLLIDNNGKGRWVDMGLAQENSKAALSEALGAMPPPRGSTGIPAAGRGDWQATRWPQQTGLGVTRSIDSSSPKNLQQMKSNYTEKVVPYLESKGLSKNEVASVVTQEIRKGQKAYKQPPWDKISDENAMEAVGLLYDGI